MKLTGDEEKAIERLKINVQKSFKTIQDNLHNCNIPDIEKAFNHKIMASFNDFKEEYRIVVGHAFHKAHKNI